MTIGFAMCGSFCTFHRIYPVLTQLAKEYNILPIFSNAVAATDTRFTTAEAHRDKIRSICSNEPLDSIQAVEPIGPKQLLDALIIAPCTGNTLAKLACGIADTPVTLAAKSHLRNGMPVVIAVSTNDALAAAAKNIGQLMNRKNIYFVPFSQDDPIEKPCSAVADFTLIPKALEYALTGRQLQPVLY